MQVLSQHRCFGGTLGYYTHAAQTTQCTMRFTVFVPPKPQMTLFFLSGLTCTEENFTVKAGAYRAAAELGITIVTPDTSPRGDDIPDNSESDIGKGAGFYINATRNPWKQHYQMESYIADELYALVLKEFPAEAKTIGIFGHSMGGHGALTFIQKYPEKYHSISAFAPICSPTRSPWGQKVFEAYLGNDKSEWKKHDATELLLQNGIIKCPVFIDQGKKDAFAERLFVPLFEEACQKMQQPCTIRYHEGYDHGYFFIQTFMEDHLRHHAKYLAIS